MYSTGRGTILVATTGTVATTAIPQTGMNTATHIAVAAVAGLVSWALVYLARGYFSRH
jgi:hypothetical protein